MGRFFLVHGAIFKVTWDIKAVGDVHAVNISPLELQNAETKRVANRSGSRRTTMSAAGQARISMRGVHEGPARLITTKGYSTTLSLSTLKHMLASKYLRQGDGIISIPLSRRTERLFGKHGSGRTKFLSTGVKLEKLGADYNPREDTCVRAFVRLLAEVAKASSEQTD